MRQAAEPVQFCRQLRLACGFTAVLTLDPLLDRKGKRRFTLTWSPRPPARLQPEEQRLVAAFRRRAAEDLEAMQQRLREVA